MIRLCDMVARIKNAQSRRRLEVVVLGSKFCEEVLECLTVEGYIRGFSRVFVAKNKASELDRVEGSEELEVFNGKEEGALHLRVFLKYKDNKGVIEQMSMISRPGCRRYYSAEELRKRFYRNELIVFTTSQGVFLNKALVLTQLNSGGEALISIG